MHEEDLKEESNTPRKEISGKWIQRLKEESWEAELLISAVAIFGTFQGFNLISWATNKFIDFLDPSQYFIAYMIVFLGLAAISVLASMFIIHFFLRAYWVGLVGLNSVFPDYSLQDSLYSETYTKQLLSILPKLKDSLQKVDEICSVIFSAAFGILITYVFLSILLTGYLFAYNALIEYFPKDILLIPAFIFLSLFAIHFVLSIVGNLGKFKRNEKLQIVLFHIARIIYILTSGPVYKSYLQIVMIFASNFKKKKGLIGLIILFLTTGFGLAAFKIEDSNIVYLIDKSELFGEPKIYSDETMLYASYYRINNQSSDFLLSPEIDSDVIKGGVFRVFIPVFKHESSLQKELCGTFESNDNESNTKLERAFELNCYHQYHQVLLDDQPLNMQFLASRHPQTMQWGIVGYVGAQGLQIGSHALTIKKTQGEQVFSEWTIPFYYLGYGQQN